MRNLSAQEMDMVSGADGSGMSGCCGDVSVLSDILSNFLNDTLNGNSLLNGNSILNFSNNTIGISVL
jgi:hypothetical protein